MLNVAEMNLEQELRVQADGSAELQTLYLWNLKETESFLIAREIMKKGKIIFMFQNKMKHVWTWELGKLFRPRTCKVYEQMLLA